MQIEALLSRSQCRVFDTQVTVKKCGPLVQYVANFYFFLLTVHSGKNTFIDKTDACEDLSNSNNVNEDTCDKIGKVSIPAFISLLVFHFRQFFDSSYWNVDNYIKSHTPSITHSSFTFMYTCKLIDSIEFYVVSAIFQPFNDGINNLSVTFQRI